MGSRTQNPSLVSRKLSWKKCSGLSRPSPALDVPANRSRLCPSHPPQHTQSPQTLLGLSGRCPHSAAPTAGLGARSSWIKLILGENKALLLRARNRMQEQAEIQLPVLPVRAGTTTPRAPSPFNLGLWHLRGTYVMGRYWRRTYMVRQTAETKPSQTPTPPRAAPAAPAAKRFPALPQEQLSEIRG